MTSAAPLHAPVMPTETLELLSPREDGLYVDCTVGLGGHTELLLAAGAGRVIGLDRDQSALAHARERLAPFAARVELVHADYRTLPAVLDARQITGVDGVLADLGVSSMQLDDAERGFSFRHDGPLDMRMNASAGETLADRLADVDEGTLADVIYQYGEERHARRIARAIVSARSRQPLSRTGELASVVRRAAGGGTWQRLDPATRTFQALRIWINGELDGLDQFLRSTVATLNTGGRLVVIAFHSLEDRIVKQTFRAMARPMDGSAPTGRILTPKPLEPTDAEREENPRSRSAKLRAMEKVA
ncbi:MAG: 16S rRNA (cytosine(1402)-N(4))-methyltransferase RsmH [Acidobacteria bacterium]|nr:16S rRNA (cytosine(1402)-N(4))-methyltransferase RsmH [Acidobacteriota bacterium]MBP8273830.1 16S rRNA (cytosine(1402)-N(4))-methyltransferase RsmH [Acidobacteriota bacterium]